MPCHHPLQAFYGSTTHAKTGNKSVHFSKYNRELFYSGQPVPKLTLDGQKTFAIPCGRCNGCRLEKSRQVAVRCMHEASLYEDNCFITLTISPDKIDKICPLTPGGYSLVKKHMQDFNKRLRDRFARGVDVYSLDGSKKSVYSPDTVRMYYCGEYGDENGRPHYHAILFGCDLPDKVYWKTKLGNNYYTSEILSDLWPYGFSTVGAVTFESCAYVARYVVKKVTGERADDHYKGRLPEFAEGSRRPGIARGWIEQYGDTDVFPYDSVVVDQGSHRGYCKPPRYYDKYLDKHNPELFAKVKEARAERGERLASDNTAKRLAVKERLQELRMKRLIRSMESMHDC